ncbi:MAG: hypothetical protein Q7T33_03535 [Dehalococcoidia bacterium]|nr:hypothetical protein [Dehalococcoidia bacterium]
MNTPFWQQKTFWVSAAGVVALIASRLLPEWHDLLVEFAAACGIGGSITARAGGVEAAGDAVREGARYSNYNPLPMKED